MPGELSPPATPAPPAIRVRDLHKTYVVTEREGGVRAALESLVRRKTQEVPAVDGISFDLAPGEIVGFLGPNGAGKTTTLKMLSGPPAPHRGRGRRCSGTSPGSARRTFLRQITLVMGQRNQLVWDIPAADSFELNRAIYRIPAGRLPAHARRADRAAGPGAAAAASRCATSRWASG